MRRVGTCLLLLLALAGGCKGKKGAAVGDGGRDGAIGDGGASDGPKDATADGKVGDGAVGDGPIACNGRCAGSCFGVCTGICDQRTDDGDCAGRCEEICVGSCGGSCMRLGGGDAGRDAMDASRDLGGEHPPVPDAGADAAVPATGWINRGNTTTLSWPPASHAGAMAYDSKRGKVVMFGGATAPGNATWEWDGTQGAWELRQQMAGTRPSPRWGHAMAYDSVRGKVVLYGGVDETGGSNNEVWEWDGVAETWAMKQPGPKPSRWGHAMAYHAGVGRIVMFGGSYRHPTLGDGDLFDIWEYDGNSDGWVNKTYPLPPAWPRARRGHALAYDATRSVTVMYGGEVQALGGPVSDLWEWDSTTNLWADRTPAPLPASWPAPRAWHGMAFDGTATLVLGGVGPALWQWDGTAWRDLTPSPLAGAWPPPRARAPVAWDDARKTLVVTGATMMVGSNALADLWEWTRP